LAGLEKKKT
jgi:hypothetical protein